MSVPVADAGLSGAFRSPGDELLLLVIPGGCPHRAPLTTAPKSVLPRAELLQMNALLKYLLSFIVTNA